MAKALAAPLALALAGALAGCVGAEHGPPALPGPGPAGDGTAHRLELVGCRTDLLGYSTEESRLEPFLPDGFSVLPTLGPVVGVELVLLACRSAVLDNASVVEGLQWFQASAGVRAPPDVASAGTPDAYLFELLVSDPSVQGLLREGGIGSTLGTIEVGRQGPATAIRVFRDGAAVYEYSGAGEVGGSSRDYAGSLRYHQAAGGRLASFDLGYQGTLSAPTVQEMGVLSAHGGFVGQSLLEPWEATVADRTAGDLTLLLEFSPQDDD